MRPGDHLPRKTISVVFRRSGQLQRNFKSHRNVTKNICYCRICCYYRLLELCQKWGGLFTTISTMFAQEADAGRHQAAASSGGCGVHCRATEQSGDGRDGHVVQRCHHHVPGRSSQLGISDLTPDTSPAHSTALVFECLDVRLDSPLCGQTTNMTQATKEEIIQKQEDERVCNRETKKLDQLLSRNQQLIQSTDSEMKRAEKLQVREGLILVLVSPSPV